MGVLSSGRVSKNRGREKVGCELAKVGSEFAEERKRKRCRRTMVVNSDSGREDGVSQQIDFDRAEVLGK